MVNGYLWLSGFSAMDFTQQVLLSLSEVLICKLPSVRHYLPKTLIIKEEDKVKNKLIEDESRYF